LKIILVTEAAPLVQLGSSTISAQVESKEIVRVTPEWPRLGVASYAFPGRQRDRNPDARRERRTPR
jgi:hypothetical protein